MAGATRGAGRGIAVELGAAGATVYVTGRSTRARRSEYDRPETIEDTADLVTAAGGTMDDVTFSHVFLKDWADYAAINGVYAEYFPDEKPARYCIQCGLVKPDALVEIASVAHVGGA